MLEYLALTAAGGVLTLVGFAHIRQDYTGIGTSVATALAILVTLFGGIRAITAATALW